MRLKIFSFFVVLMLIVDTFAPVSKVKAQSLVEIALTLPVLVIGSEQEIEILYKPDKPEKDFAKYRLQFYIRTTDVTGGSVDGSCMQTVQTLVDANAGLNSLRLALSEGNKALVINSGEVEVPLEFCFGGTKRFAFEVGMPVPSNMMDRFVSNPDEIAAALKKDIYSVSILDSKGNTVAIGSDAIKVGFIYKPSSVR